jgi:YHS domain-containing protein
MIALIRTLTLAVALALPAATLAQGKAPALKGHDPVAYFVDGRPVKGTPSITYDFDESRYQFSKPKHRELFAADPDRYAPQFTGLCTAGLAKGMKAEADPSIWKIVDGKLYLFSSVQAREQADKDPSLLAKAHQVFKAPN